MIEWIIFIVISLVTSEILFWKFGNSEGWLPQKIFMIMGGIFFTIIIFGIPYTIAYCDSFIKIPETCHSYGPISFLWYYGIIISVIVFFWGNWWLINKKEEIENRKSKEKKK